MAELEERDVVVFTSDPRFVAGYARGIEDGVTVGLRMADEERQAEADANDRALRRLAVQLRQSPTQVQRAARLGDGPEARSRQAAAAAQAARVWAGWSEGTG